jgi:hypothetical protein
LSHDSQSREDLAFYVGLSEKTWNGVSIPPSFHRLCISPVFGRRADSKRETRILLLPGTENVGIIQDSGAFSDSHGERLSPAEAWDRQTIHAEKYGYERNVEFRVSYDRIIDESWIGGKRYKRRWSYADAQQAVDETVAAAHYTDSQRNSRFALIQSAQGVEPKQYLDCVKRIMPYVDPVRDKIGLGGFCLIGINRSYLSSFLETIRLVLPFVAGEGVKSVHLFGVCYPPALGVLLWEADKFGIQVSTDSTSPGTGPVFGKMGLGDWRQRVGQVAPQNLGYLRLINVCHVRQYLAQLRDTQYYNENLAYSTKICEVCGNAVSTKAKTCSPRCRKRKSRIGKGGIL